MSGPGRGIGPHPLQAAIVAHAAWKKRLRTAIETGRPPEGIDTSTAARDTVCAFGVWLHSGQAAELDRVRAVSVTAQHAAFHRTAAAVLTAATSGRRDQAAELMSSPDAYGGAASALTDALVEWGRVVEAGSVRQGQPVTAGR